MDPSQGKILVIDTVSQNKTNIIKFDINFGKPVLEH